MAERWLAWILVLLVSGCGAKTAEERSESNTNWLQRCDEDAECGEALACRCGVCTKNCERDSCPAALTCLAACGESALACQAACQSDADCAYLDGNATCLDGVCGLESKGLSQRRIEAAEPPRLIEEAQIERAVVAEDAALVADTTGAAWRLIEVPAASNQPSLVHTPLGWLALSSRVIGDGRAPSGYESALYRSVDGVHWEALPLDVPDDDINFRTLAYGADRYVMVGRRLGATGVFWVSSDGEEWTEVVQEHADPVLIWGHVAFAGQYFFAFGTQYMGVSEDGVSWTKVPITAGSLNAITYGNGRYLMVGSGPMHVSDDGFSWQSYDVDCALPGACIQLPSSASLPGSDEPEVPGEVVQSSHSHALYAEGRFWSDQLSSVDGISWESHPGRYPAQYVEGHFFGPVDLNLGIPTWVTGGELEALQVVRPLQAASTEAGRSRTSIGVLDREAPLPDRVDVSFDDGLTCETATCIEIDGRLVLIPPLGTPPLTDRVPRTAEGTPLLSDDCPVSSQLFCTDYEARTGCVCEPDAPRSPEWCDDVSQYQCQGRFTPRENEWELDEIREGGCDCDYVDPNQPLGFGTDCAADMTVCSEPLQCLALDAIVSAGPPYQPYGCTLPCSSDADCPSWEATGFCAGPVELRCSTGSCQPRQCQ